MVELSYLSILLCIILVHSHIYVAFFSSCPQPVVDRHRSLVLVENQVQVSGAASGMGSMGGMGGMGGHGGMMKVAVDAHHSSTPSSSHHSSGANIHASQDVRIIAVPKLTPNLPPPMGSPTGWGYSEHAITEVIQLNDVEEWEMINTTPDNHVMHLHLVQFEVPYRSLSS